jgi:hypothetical protein
LLLLLLLLLVQVMKLSGCDGLRRSGTSRDAMDHQAARARHWPGYGARLAQPKPGTIGGRNDVTAG